MENLTRIRRSLPAWLLVLGLAGCADNGGHDASEEIETIEGDSQPLARLQITPELSADFFELQPGVLMTVGRGQLGGPTLDSVLPDTNVATLRPSDFYRIFASQADMPRALVDAEAKMPPRSAPIQLPSPRFPLAGVAYDSADKAIDPNSFSRDQCRMKWAAQANFRVCLLNGNKNNSVKKGYGNFYNGAVGASVGSVVWEFKVFGGGLKTTSFRQTVQEGQAFQNAVQCTWTFLDGCDEFEVHSSVTGVSSSERFHQAVFMETTE